MSSLPPPPSRTRSIRNSASIRPEGPSDIDTEEAIVKDANELRTTQSPSRLPVTRNLRTGSISSRNLKDGSMLPPPPRLTNRLELSRPPVTRSAVLDAEKRSLQRQTSTSRPTRAGSVSSTSTADSNTRQLFIPTSTHSRTSSISTSKLPDRGSLQQPNTFGHRRNASTNISQITGNVPSRRPSVTKNSRPLSMSASPYPEKGSPQQLQQPRPSTRQTRSSISTAPANPRANGHTRNTSILLNDSTILRPPIVSPALVDPKPAFSTLQQHYSPNKKLGPKPQTASYLAPPSPSKLPENKLISAETAKLQSELLQLHLLHREYASVRKEWEANAKQKLCKKFEKVAERHRQLLALEEKDQAQINSLAFKKWAGSKVSAWGLEEISVVLGEVMTGIWNLSEPGGKYSKVVRRFEKWHSKVQSIIAMREEKTEEGSIQFIEKLEATWSRESDALIRKLEHLNDQLDGLGAIEEDGSSLAQALNDCRNLTQGMLMELEIMKSIEHEMLAREDEWIRQSVDEVSDEDVQEAVGSVAVWRR